MGLLLCGFSLILLQLVLNWHLGPVLHSSELPWLLVSCTALLGQALGYGWRSRKWPAIFLVLTLFAPVLASQIRNCQGGAWTTLLLSASLALTTSFPLSHLVACYWHWQANASIRTFYRRELLGVLSALVLTLALGPIRSTLIFPWGVVLAAWSLHSRLSRAFLLVLATLASLSLSGARQQGARSAFPGATLVAQEVSPYQYVEVVDTAAGRFLFLNGLCHYGPPAYKQLNTYLAQIPARRLPDSARRAGCLVLGAGTFVAPALVAEQGLETTVIELDPAVVKLGIEYFQQSRPAGDHFQITTGDARVLLRRHPPVGLVVINLPSPYSLNVASLFTQEFFREVRGKLVPGGVCSVFLGAPLDPAGANSVQGPTLAALQTAFPHSLAISSRSCDNTVVYSSSDPLGSLQELRRDLRAHGQNRFTLYSREQLEGLTRGIAPASLNDLSLCAALNRTLWMQP